MSPIPTNIRLNGLLEDFDRLPRIDRGPTYGNSNDPWGAYGEPNRMVLEDPGFSGYAMATIEPWVVRAEAALIDVFGKADSRVARFQKVMKGNSFTSIAQLDTANRLRGMIEAAHKDVVAGLAPAADVEATLPSPEASAETGQPRIFLVHGRDDAAKETVARFLERLNLRVVILHEQPNEGRTLVEKFEAHSNVDFAVVILTPDDSGHAASEPENKMPRARQNVVFELGYFYGLLRRSRVCALHTSGIELPSDLHGVAYVPFEKDWKLLLAREIKAADIPVDLNLAM
jgi:predicted nucleotide-binding protein